MGWTPFKYAKSQVPPATVATSATLHSSEPRTVARVATVAAALPKTSADPLEGKPETVATVATVAGHTPETCDFSIPLDEVAASYAGTVAALMNRHGLPAATAEGGAVDIVRACLRNDPRLTPRQMDPTRCLICGRPNSEATPLVPVLSARTLDHLWLHRGACHREHQARQKSRAVSLLAEAIGNEMATPKRSQTPPVDRIPSHPSQADVDWQAAVDARAGVPEYDAGLTSVEAERIARMEVFKAGRGAS